MAEQIHLGMSRRIGKLSLAGRQADYQQGDRRRNDTPSHLGRPTECESCESRMEAFRQDGLRGAVQSFFIRIGAKYRRIRKCPRGKPSPQLYAYK